MTILFVIMSIIVFTIAVYMLGGAVIAKAIEFFNDINNFYVEKIVEFEYVKGMVFSQKQKNVPLHHLPSAG